MFGTFLTVETDLATMVSGITGALSSFSVGNLTTVVVAGIGIAIPLVLAWFGIRFVVRKATGALKGGKM